MHLPSLPGLFGAWDRATNPANYWLGMLRAACLVAAGVPGVLAIRTPEIRSRSD
jgi:hypothetical protein